MVKYPKKKMLLYNIKNESLKLNFESIQTLTDTVYKFYWKSEKSFS